jgi:cytochrome c-type biogenesis protein CcmF
MMAIGVIGSTGFKIEKDVTLAPGQEATIGGYRVVYNGLTGSKQGTKEVMAASLTAYSGSQTLGTLTPSKEFFQNFENPNTEVAIHSTVTDDLYIILNSWDAQQRAGLKLVVNPLVTWLWAGGYMLLLGSIIAFWPAARTRRKEALGRSIDHGTLEGVRPAGA